MPIYSALYDLVLGAAGGLANFVLGIVLSPISGVFYTVLDVIAGIFGASYNS